MSQVKLTTLMTSDGLKQATSDDVIDGATKTKLFSPFSLAMLASVDAAALRASIAAAKSGANGDITSLTGITTPLSAAQGGISPGYIEGLNWVVTGANTVVVESGAAVCPYTAGNRNVALAAPVSLNVPTQVTPNYRVHLWLHADGGTPTIAFDTNSPVTNYYGSAYKHPTNDGWRYLGSPLLGTDFNLVRQQSINRRVLFSDNLNTARYTLINTTGTTSARTVATDTVLPSTVSSVLTNILQGAVVNRFAASSAVCGFTISSANHTYAATAPSAQYEMAIGSDRILQYIADSAGATCIMQVLGYTYKR